MPDPQPIQTSPAVVPPGFGELASRWIADDADIALGCECADPALQIERWAAEHAAASALSAG